MHRFFLYALGAFLALLVGSLHLIALRYSLYWEYRAFDVPMHLLGGLMLGIPLATLLSGWGLRTRTVALGVLAGVTLFGIAWELFELRMGLTFLGHGFALDTAGDFFNNTLGGLVGLLLVRKLYVRD